MITELFNNENEVNISYRTFVQKPKCISLIWKNLYFNANSTHAEQLEIANKKLSNSRELSNCSYE